MSIRNGILAFMLTFAGLQGVRAQDSAGENSKAATRPADVPATQPVKLDPAVEKILDRLEKKQVHDIEARLTYQKVDPILADKQVYTGVLRFRQEEPNPRFFIRFDRRVHDGIPSERKEWHVFDGQFYIEAREKTETIVRRQVVRPGEKVEVFRIGKGPFPLPFGQKKQDIARHFEIRLVPPSPKDPKGTKNTDHLVCKPRPGTELHDKYGSVHFYIDRKLDLPVCLKTIERDEGNEITATFADIKLNTGMAASRLDLPDLDYKMTTEWLDPPGERDGAKERTRDGERAE